MGPEAFLVGGAACLVGAAVQSATGLGFALVASPLLLTVVAPPQAVGIVVGAATVVGVLTLFAEGRTPRVDRGFAVRVVAAAVPGMVAGALVVDDLPTRPLQVAIGALVLLAGTAQARAGGIPARDGARSPAAAPVYGVGLLAGGLTTTTGVNGPPLLLWLLRTRLAPGTIRDSLAATFLALNLCGAVALVATGAHVGALSGALAGVLLALTAAGYLVGRAAFRRLAAERFRWLALAIVLASGAGSIVAGLV